MRKKGIFKEGTTKNPTKESMKRSATMDKINQRMRIVPAETIGQGHSIEAEFHLRDRKHKIFFRSIGDAVLSGNLESFLASAILPCMRLGGGSLLAEGEVSQKFITALSTIQDIYAMWDPSLYRTVIKNAVPIARAGSTEKRVGTFFSGGVDSFYTFLRHKNEITDLIFVHGFDIRLKDAKLREKTSKKIREIALSFGKNVIEIETNLREMFDSYVKWGLLGHGAALAAIGHLLFPMFCRIYIPATHTYAELFRWGSHPILDYLWSSECLEFVHDGCEATRVKKVSLISRYDIALRSLRVCFKNPNSSYNCGRCEKCLRTMINLKVNNALSRCSTFDEELDLRRVSKITAKDENTRAFIRENLDALEQYQGNDELTEVLRKVLNKPQWPRKIERRLKAKVKNLYGKRMKRAKV